MKNSNSTIRTALRLAASASVALVAMVSSAHSQNLLVNGSFETYSGGSYSPNDTPDWFHNTWNTLVVPGWDFQVGLSSDIHRDLNAPNAQSSYYDAYDGDFLASSGANSYVNEGISQIFSVAPDTTYELSFMMAPGGINYGGSWIEYAITNSSWQVEITGALCSPVDTSFSTDSNDFGLTATTNPLEWTKQTLQFTSDSTGGSVTLLFRAHCNSTFPGKTFLDDVSVVSLGPGTCEPRCVIERELRSGMQYDSHVGWYSLYVGATDFNVRQVSLPENYTSSDLSSAFATLGPPVSGGANAITPTPSSHWTGLSQSAGWIYGGENDKSVLYAHDFQLPSPLPSILSVTLDLEWAADDQLTEVYMNGVQLSIQSGANGPNDYSAPTTNSITVNSLLLKPGLNTLYFLQDDLHDAYSGIIYIADLEVEYDCGSSDEEISYSSFCECVSDWGPCGNPGQPGQGCGNSTGVGSSLTASGTSSNINLHADNLPLGQTIGLFFKGDNVIGPLSFGDGLRCVGGETIRLDVVITNTGQADLHLQSSLSPGEPTAGYYQFWYRDSSGPCGSGFNLTDAIEIY